MDNLDFNIKLNDEGEKKKSEKSNEIKQFVGGE